MKVGYLALGTVLGAGIVGGIWLITQKAPESLWKAGDVLWCWPYPYQGYYDPGPATVTDTRRVNGTWEYHVFEGEPDHLLTDMGWRAEDELLSAPFTCTLWEGYSER